MIALANTTDKIQINLKNAFSSNRPEFISSYKNYPANNVFPNRVVGLVAGTTYVDVTPSPIVGEQNVLETFSIKNTDTINHVVTVMYNASGDLFTLFQATIAPNESIEYNNGWRVFATSGAIKQSINQGDNAITSLMSAVVLGADVINNNAVANTMANVTGLSFSVLANKTYWFKFVIPYTAQATTTGSRWGVNASAGLATNLSFKSEYSLTATTITPNANVQAFDSPATSNATSASLLNNMCIMEGYFKPTADGTFIARFASEVAGSAITAKAGAVCYYQQLN